MEKFSESFCLRKILTTPGFTVTADKSNLFMLRNGRVIAESDEIRSLFRRCAWQRLAAYGIERGYNQSDVENLLKHLVGDEVYEPEFQQKFIDGIRICEDHPYPFKWHVSTSVQCPKCVRESNSIERMSIQ